MRLIFLIYTFFLPAISIIAQQPYNHYTVRNGLPTNTINSIMQDENGIMWMATNSGTVKYDGRFFKTFDIEKGLKTNDVFDIVPGNGERVYIMDFADDLSYVYHDSVFTVKTGSDRIDYVCNYKLLNYFIAENRKMAARAVSLIKDDSVYTINVAAVIKSMVPNATALSIGYPYSIWIDTGQICTFDITTKQISRKQIPGIRKIAGSIAQDLNGIFVLAYGNDLFLFNAATQQLKQVNLGNKQGIGYHLKQVVPTRRSIQLTTENGLLVYNRDLELTDSFRINTRDEAITSIYKDARNNIWLVTAGGGLKFIDNYYRTTLNITRPEQTEIEFYDGRLYTVNANGDIVVMDAKAGTIINIPVRNFSNGARNIRNVYMQHTDKGMIVATLKNISLVNGTKSTDYVSRLIEATNENLQSLKGMHYSGNRLYLLLHDGIYCETGKRELSRVIAGKFIKMAIVSNGSLWAADNNHLYRMNKDHNGQFAAEGFALPDKQLQSLNEPGTMQADDHANLLLTYDNYFVCYNIPGNKVTKYKYENKIKGAKLCGDKLFVFTNGYIDYYAFDKIPGAYKRQERFYNFDNSLYEEIKGLTASDSNLYISNTQGIVITPLNNRLIPDSGFITKTFVSSISHRNQVFSRTDTANDISLRYSRGQTTFHISSTSLSYGRAVSYRYFLEGLDEKWQTGTSPDISYTGLPAKHYTFHFMAVANKYELQGREQTFTIDVQPLWWQRNGLRFSILMLLLGAGFYSMSRLIIARKNKQLRQVLIEKQISDVRLGTLQSQMNPHFVFNALTSVQSFLKQDKNELAGDYLLKFTQLIRLYLEFSRKRFISLQEEIQALKLYTDIESNRFNHKFVVEYRQEGIPEDHEILIPPMIIQPFVENAVVHGLYHKTDGPGLLLLDFRWVNNQLIVTVDDNGIGRKRAEEINSHYTKVPSRGNEIVNERIKILADQEIMHIDATVEDKAHDGIATGTKVTIIFNIKSTAG